MLRGRLDVMWDWYAFPVWNAGPGSQVNVDELPISRELRDSLQAWSDERTRYMDSWYDPEADPPSVEPEGSDDTEWLAHGRLLTERLRDELGPDYEVAFFSERTGGLE